MNGEAMTKLTIAGKEFDDALYAYRNLVAEDKRQFLTNFIDARLAEAYEQGKSDSIRVIEAHKIPLGNSVSGELAAEWTLDALHEIRAEIRKLPKEPTA
jgi:hypothetical protein